MFYSVDHNPPPPHFVNSASLSCWFPRRCFTLVFISFSTDGSWWFLPNRRCIISFVRSTFNWFISLDFPLAVFVVLALVRTVLHYPLFRRSSCVFHCDSILLGFALILVGFTWGFTAGVLCTMLLGPGVHSSLLLSIRLSSAADLKETTLRFSNDPFSICTVCLVNFSIFNGKRLYLLGSFGSVFAVLWYTVVELVLCFLSHVGVFGGLISLGSTIFGALGSATTSSAKMIGAFQFWGAYTKTLLFS